MNPSSNQPSGMELPPPVVEQAPTGGNVNVPETVPAVPEKAAATPERAPAPSAAPPSTPVMQLPTLPVIQSTTPSNGAQPATPTAASPPITDDGDLIEKEWVSKAKAIVEKTRDDPYKQTEELTVFKADYMQKRYGKTIKLNQ